MEPKAISEEPRIKGVVDALRDEPGLLNAFLGALYIRVNLPSCRSPYYHELLKTLGNQETLIQVSDEIRSRGLSLDFEALISLFEYVISPATRVVTGSVYTPRNIRQYIVRHVFADYTAEELETCRIVDFSCGCGAFLLDAAEYVHALTGKPFAAVCQENIFGYDINDFAVERCRLLLSLMALSKGEEPPAHDHLYVRDALSLRHADAKYDVIVGNPPYVCARKMDQATFAAVKQWPVAADGNSDLYIVFLQMALSMLREGGRLGLIIPNGFLKSLNARSLRAYLQTEQLRMCILDFKGARVFKSRSTYTCICMVEKRLSEVLHYAVDEKMELPDKPEYQEISYKALNPARGWNLNRCELMQKMEAQEQTIGSVFTMRHGIATLCNRVYILPFQHEGELYTVERNGRTYYVESALCRKIVNSNSLMNGSRLEDKMTPVIFPYRILPNGRPELMAEGVLAAEFPHAYEYLMAHRHILMQRDKGKLQYPWYAYGRTQSLKLPRYKLFIPKISNRRIEACLVDNADLLFYNGLGFVSDNFRELLFLKKIVDSALFWEYVCANSKPYSSGYFALDNMYIKQFGIPSMSPTQKQRFLSTTSPPTAERILRKAFGLD